MSNKEAWEKVIRHDMQGLAHTMSEINFTEIYETGKLLGKGKYASVHSVKLMKGPNAGEIRAMKIFVKASQGKDKVAGLLTRVTACDKSLVL